MEPTHASGGPGVTQAARSSLDQGIAASRTGQSQDACQHFEAAMHQAPGWALPCFMLASERAAMGDYEQAEALFAQSVLLAPDAALARYQLGFLQYTSGRTQLAQLTWAPLLDSPESEPFVHLVRAFGCLQGGDAPKALAHFDAALPLAQANAGLVADIGRLKALCSALCQQGGEAESSSVEPAAEGSTEEAQHLFVSNYSRSLH